MTKVSVIIRAKNEERWIGACLKAVFDQDFEDYEVILVDNHSTDNTVEIAKNFPLTELVSIDSYKPGKAINIGIRSSVGKLIVLLSAHCIPKHRNWLRNLASNFDEPKTACVYGRQESLPFSSDLDKRDLAVVFGLDKRIQKKDYFFHNANSMIRRDIWEQIPFDENVSNIEDRVWAKQIIQQGWQIIYEPEAEVYHYHGINQSSDLERCEKIVRIIEKMENHNYNNDKIIDQFQKLNIFNIYAILPVLGKALKVESHDLMARCVGNIHSSKLVKDIVVITEDDELLNSADSMGVIGFKRPKELSDRFDHGMVEVFNYCINNINHYGLKINDTDLILYVNYLYPFRPENLVFSLLRDLLSQEFESVIYANSDSKNLWVKENGRYKRLDKGFRSLNESSNFYTGIAGMGTLTTAKFIRNGHLLGDSVGLLLCDNPLYTLKVVDPYSYHIAQLLLNDKVEGRIINNPF